MTTILDGAMGTELRARGAVVPDYETSIWSALALSAAPDMVRQIHADYIAAGADVITANNYAVVPKLLQRENMEDRLEDLTVAACDLAQAARRACGRTGIRIAGSLAPLDTTYRPDLVGSEEELYASYRRIVGVLKGRVDLVIAETLTTAREARAAARAAADAGLPVWISWNIRLDAPVLRGGESISAAVGALNGLPVEAFLINCAPTGIVSDAVSLLRSATSASVGAYANSCRVAESQGELDQAPAGLDPDGYARAAAGWIGMGATIVGGCCDTTPAHIAALRGLVDEAR